ncbi:S1-like domain-containing RNA-binding protein [Mesobacillus maritimus]|uniref:CvfB family protein n=1 Tax=Mesobacillus maritimus TaxID=1643336 RepID=UPI00204232FF|nr:S1-like domain-containing RNA-binding protein [Mesobacillus maritimus]MCM3586110.1 S1-like domain-containing RNA-binding protein [Mesobacillus maritimus]MCM3667437.1 S1-like domain-containing RNA-binding protein [Mesobacillus maritimus]
MTLQDHTGRTIQLSVARISNFGYFLTDGEEDVLLHHNDNDNRKELEEGEEVEVFLYVDSRGRLAATTKIPVITVGEYAWVSVVDVKPEIGVFVNIGINKDILLGKEDLPILQSVWPQVGDMLYLTLRVNRNFLIYAKLASDQVIQGISQTATRRDFNKNVHGHIYRTARVGSWMITAEGFKGFIHESQRSKEPRVGEKVEGRIIDVKEDGTVNISLLPRKQEALDEDATKILEYLDSRNGAMPYSDKSMAEDINDRFNMSKSSFKRAIGRLMKEGRVYQEEGWTYKK